MVKLKKARTLFYKPFAALEGFDTINNEPYRIASFTAIKHLIEAKEWHASRMASAELIKTGLSGLHYLQTYERLLIRGIVTAAYIGWAAYASLYIFRPLDFVVPQEAPGAKFVHAMAAVILVGFWALFTLQHAPSTFYVYIAFPCYFWHEFLLQAMVGLRMPPRLNLWKMLLSAMMIVAVLQAMVLAYTYRFIWSIGFVIIGVMWPITWPWQKLKQNIIPAIVWGLLCLVAAVFPLLSVEKQESLPTILSGGCMILICGAFAASWVLEDVESHKGKASRQMLTTVFTIQAILIVAIMAITSSSVRSLQSKQGLPVVNQVLGWIFLGNVPGILVISAKLI
ncbi:hypothetical protein C0991_012475 [Blastosporella zonata]|nr:hypothetical protein C0991_012475 [Blastosporella zonata]